ncbi:MAG TPA: alpha/beta fold hydrolase, partial [Casimicrobiaceae bacterium]|nr:alpha/beta fold hydrolase [Casimicrobiaceae bacterium]
MPHAVSRLEAPSLALLGVEPLRAAIEYAAMRVMARDALPRGDGHAVVVFPGLGAGARAMAPLQRHCAALGYVALDWGRGVNRGPDDDVEGWLARLADDVMRMVEEHPSPVTLLGWSLGGIYAREVAKRVPDRVRQVITIGTPLAGTPESTNAGWLYRLLKGRSHRVDASVVQALRVAPPVPTTSIYSRTDGVVPWQACRAAMGPCVENIEVKSSHLGLVCHPRVLGIVAERLAQPAGRWRAAP